MACAGAAFFPLDPVRSANALIALPIDRWDGLLEYGTYPAQDHESDSQECRNVVPRKVRQVLRSSHCVSQKYDHTENEMCWEHSRAGVNE